MAPPFSLMTAAARVLATDTEPQGLLMSLSAQASPQGVPALSSGKTAAVCVCRVPHTVFVLWPRSPFFGVFDLRHWLPFCPAYNFSSMRLLLPCAHLVATGVCEDRGTIGLSGSRRATELGGENWNSVWPWVRGNSTPARWLYLRGGFLYAKKSNPPVMIISARGASLRCPHGGK